MPIQRLLKAENLGILSRSKLRYAYKRFFSTGRHQEGTQTWYDVIVVGGGHAGTEAAGAAARMGRNTLLVTHKACTIGEMSCNPSFGGVGKGHLMKEIDALGGVCAQACDETGCHYRMLNKSKGPAVWGPRAQIDRQLYKEKIQDIVFSTPNLSVLAQPVEDLLLTEANGTDGRIADHLCCGVKLENGEEVYGKCVVLTTGTFLRGCINTGPEVRPAGRLGDAPSIGLADTLENLGFKLSRLKTGTPPRVDGKTVDFSKCIASRGDNPIVPFSFMSDRVKINPEDQLTCYVTFAPESDEFRSIITENMHLNRHIREEVNGPRYCPSIESKILRFPRKAHQVWLEPEGFSTDLVYPQGLSCTLPADLQQKMVNLVPGLENAQVIQPGYGVEYDFMDPRQIKTSLETHKVENLYFAGQINGTTGYEEAGAQGIIAGINAALRVENRDPITVSRTEGYIGVLIDDLTTHGTNEPYRMFTSRAEFRLHLRADNADLRLTEKGYRASCVSEARYVKMTSVRRHLSDTLALLKDYARPASYWEKCLARDMYSRDNSSKSAFTVLLHQDVSAKNLADALPETFGYLKDDATLCERLQIEALYESCIAEQREEMEEIRREEQMILPEDLNYASMNIISFEAREKLCAARPQTIAAASRIQGMTPAAILSLLRHVKKRQLRTS